MNSGWKKRITGCLSKHPAIQRFLRRLNSAYRIRVLAPYCRILARCFPNAHARRLSRSTIPDRLTGLPDLRRPVRFDEKLLWLKYRLYNSSPLVAACYDKYLVRQYVTRCGCADTLNTLYGVWDSIDEIPWDTLPDAYVLKITNGCSNHVFKYPGIPLDVEDAKRTLTQSKNRQWERYSISGDLFATRLPQRYICERLLPVPEGSHSVSDYKFYCYHGEPKYLLYISNRNQQTHGYHGVFYTADLQDRCAYYANLGGVLEPPACYDAMLSVARKLSRDFPFVRVDLYADGDRPIFGELTFTPAGSIVPHHTHSEEVLLELGKPLHLERVGEYGILTKNGKAPRPPRT